MGNRGRFGKYGEIKRLDRLRQAGLKGLPHLRPETRVIKGDVPFRKAGNQTALVKIRQAAGTDTPFIEELSRRVFHVYGPYEEMIPRWFESQTTITLVAVMNTRPVGFAMVGRLSAEDQDHPGLELLAIAVEPQKHKLGIGETLLKEVEKVVAGLRVKRWFLHTAKDNLPARRLFTRCGYRTCELRERFYPSGQDALLMVRELEGWNPG